MFKALEPRPATERVRLRSRFARVVVPLAAVFTLGSIVAHAQDQAPAQAPEAVVSPAPAPEPAPSAEESLRNEVDRLFRVLRLRDGVLLEPREDIDGVAAVEIDKGTFIIDGSPVTRNELRERLGADVADVVERLSALEARSATSTFGGEGRPTPRVAPTPAPAPTPGVSDAPEDESDAEARSRRRGRVRSRTDSQFVVGDSLVIAADEEAREAVVLGGDLTIRGIVIGDAVVIGGSAVVEENASVTGDLVALGGSVTLHRNAEVMGDVVTLGKDVKLDDSALIGGKLVEVPFGPRFSFGDRDHSWDFWDDNDWWDSGFDGFSGVGRAVDFAGTFVGLLFFALLACLAYLLATRPIERMRLRVELEFWKASVVGLVTSFLLIGLLPLAALILLISLVGIFLLPLLPFVVMAVWLAAFLGYTAVALSLGNWLERRFEWNFGSPYVAIIVGIGAIHGISLMADLFDFIPGLGIFGWMLGVVGFVVKFVIWMAGLGAAVLTRFGTRDDLPPAVDQPLPPVPDVGSGDLTP